MHCLITRIALIFSVGFLVCSHAKAQDCGLWLNVGAWQVTFSITGMGSGKPTASGGSQYTWTISQNGSGSALLSPSKMQCPTGLGWGVLRPAPDPADGGRLDGGSRHRFYKAEAVLTRGSLAHGGEPSSPATRSVALGTAYQRPLQRSAQLDTTTINGRTYTSAFNALSKSYVNTFPQKRTVTTVLDSLERISSSQVGTLLPVSYSYDTYGRLSTISQGARTVNLAYDPTGFLISVTDPLKLPTTFTHDADGRLLTTTLPDGPG